MSSATNFRVKLTLCTPFTLTAPLTLDALLSAAVANATGLEGEATIPHIPLEQRSGVFLGSSLSLHPGFRYAPVGRVMSLTGERDLSVDLFHPKGKQYAYIDQARGDYKRNLSAYPGYLAREVYFYGRGDAERVEYLLTNFVLGIGKRWNAGAGEIVAVSVTDSNEDYSWKTKSGTPARPLPVVLWLEIGGDPSMPTLPLAVSVPYWRNEKAEAVFPVAQ